MAFKFTLEDNAYLYEVAYVARWLRNAIMRAIVNETLNTGVYDGEAVAKDLKDVLPRYEEVLHDILEIDKGTRPGGRYQKNKQAGL